MRNLERKERNFLSKLFRAISLYMIIVLCAFFTYITFFGVSDSSSNEQAQGSAPQQATPTEMLLNAFMNSSNVSANASLSVSGEDLSLGATIDAIVDMKTFDFDVSVLLTVGEEVFEISALKNSEEDEFLHFSVNDLKVKLDLADANFSDLIENFDFSAVFGDLVSAEDISKILEDIGRVLGLNLNASSLDDLLSEITNKVSIKVNTLENGYRFVIYLGNLRVTLDASTDFKTLSASVDMPKISGYTTKLEIGSIKLDLPESDVSTPTGDEIDISSLMKILENAKIAEDTYALSSRINVTVGETEFDGEVSAKIVDTLPILRAKVTAFGAEAYVYYINNRLYLSVENLNLFLDIDNFDYDAITEILNRFDVELDKENFEAISVTLPALSAISVEILENEFNVGISDVIKVGDVEISGVSASFETVTEGDNILPNSLNLTFNMATSDWQNNVQLTLNNIKIGKSAEGLNDTVFGEEPLSLMTKNGLVPVEDFVDLNNLLKVAKTAVQAENITFNLDAKMGQIALSGTGKFDIPSMSFNLDLELNIKGNNDGLSLKFFLYGEDIASTKTIYMTIGERSFKVDITKMNLESLLAELGVSVDTTGLIEKIESELKIDFENIDLLDILKNLELTETKTDVLSYAISLNGNSVIVKFNEETGALSVDFSKIIDGDEVKISLSNIITNAPDFTLFTPTGDEVDISKIFDIVEDAKIAEDTYALSADLYVRYSASTFEGDILAMLLKDGNNLVPYVRVKTSAMSLETYIYLIDETVYVDLQGLRISADLNEGSVDTIMNFIADLGLDVGGLDGLTTAFNVTLPALSTISANWIDGGVRIYAGDIAYTETARFEDIVIDAFGALSNGKVLLDKLVVGANIVNLTDGDANATNVASLSKPFSTSGERNGEFKEDAITSDKNFAVYLTGLRIGQSVLFKEDIVFDENGNVVSLCGNGGVYEVGDFTNYQTLLPLVEKVYNYVTKSNNFQVGLTANIGGNALSGDVVMSLTDDVNSPLFGGRGLKVQGDLTLESGAESKHAFSIYYNSDRDVYDNNGNALSGLFFTYAHNEFIESDTKFRGRIEDGNMSDLISMILGIANVDIDEDNAWNLKNSTTDFSFLHQLLGIGENDIGEDIGKVDGILKDVSGVLKMLKKISFKTTDSNYSLIVDFDLGAANADAKSGSIASENIGKIVILFDNSGNLTNISFSLGDDLSANVEILAYDEESFNYFDNNSFNSHHNLSSLPEFMDIAVNKMNERTINLSGTAHLKILTEATAIDIDVEVLINLEDFSVVAYLSPEALSGTTYLSEFSAFFGATTKYSTVGKYDKRVSTITFAKDGSGEYMLTINQDTDGSVKKWSYTTAEILGTTDGTSSIIIIMAQAIGLTDSMVGLINWGMGLVEPNISLEETLKSFARNTVTETTESGTIVEKLTGYTLGIKGETLTGTSLISDFDLTMGVSENNEKYALSSVITNLKIFGSMVTLDLNLSIL